jgi:hypothetical protein
MLNLIFGALLLLWGIKKVAGNFFPATERVIKLRINKSNLLYLEDFCIEFATAILYDVALLLFA